MTEAKVAILMGSISDREVMQAAGDVLESLGIPYEIAVRSAHRTPVETSEFIRQAEEAGVQVLICGAGMAAHLAGVVAAESLLPVIGVPLGASLGGLDALLATVQMPPGIPVGTVAIGKAGAKNAAWLAARILALGDADLAATLVREKAAMAQKVLAADAQLQRTPGG